MQRETILNSKGEPIVLSDRDQMQALMLERQFQNSLGYEVNITTMFTILAQIIEQKFFELAPADYVPVRVGNGAWSEDLLTYRDFQSAGDFEAGNIDTGASNSRMAEANSAVDSVVNKVITWAKITTWTLADIAKASRSGNWDVVTSKERSRKKNWDLGIQKILFLGSGVDASVMGLLTQSAVNSNTTLIQKYINTMSVTEFTALVQGIVQAYRANCNYTAWPTHFVIPEADYNGLATPVSGTFPVITMLEYLQKTFAMICRNPNFKIMPCAYANQANNATYPVLNKNRYALYNMDLDSLRADIPVDYTNTMQNTINGFQFQNVAYGQYTGVLAYRSPEMLYFDWNT